MDEEDISSERSGACTAVDELKLIGGVVSGRVDAVELKFNHDDGYASLSPTNLLWESDAWPVPSL